MHARLPLPLPFFRSGIIFVAFPMLALDVYAMRGFALGRSAFL